MKPIFRVAAIGSIIVASFSMASTGNTIPPAHDSSLQEVQPQLTEFTNREKGVGLFYPQGWHVHEDGGDPKLDGSGLFYYFVFFTPQPLDPNRGEFEPVLIHLTKHYQVSTILGNGTEAQQLDRYFENFIYDSQGTVIAQRDAMVDGVPVRRVEMEVTLPQGLKQRRLALLAIQDDVLTTLFCGALSSEFEAFRPLFDAVLSRTELFSTDRTQATLLKKKLTRAPSTAEEYSERVAMFWKADKVAEAISMNNKWIASDHESPKAYMTRGSILSELGEFDEAIADFDKALSLIPLPVSENDRDGLVDTHLGLAVVYDKTGELGKGIEAAKKAIALKPKYDETYFRLGMLYFSSGMAAEAQEMFRKVAEMGGRRAGAAQEMLERLDER